MIKNKSFVLFFIFSLFAGPLFSESGEDIGNIYFSAAEDFYNRGMYGEASVFLKKSFLFDPDSSDRDFLAGMIEYKTNGNHGEALRLFRRALLNGRWKRFSDSEALYNFGMISLDEKNYEKAVSAFYVIKDEYFDDLLFQNAYSAALMDTGDFESAGRVIKEALVKFPGDCSLSKKLVSFDADHREKMTMELLEKDNFDDYDPSLIFAVIAANSDAGVKRELLEKYEAELSRFPEFFIESIKSGSQESSVLIDRFADAGGFGSYELYSGFYDILRQPSLKKYYIDKFSNCDVVVRSDPDSNGKAEIEGSFEKGKPLWIRFDENQDNIDDCLITYENGIVRSAEFPGCSVFYSFYPYVSKIIKFSEKYSEMYTYKGRIFALRIAETDFPPKLFPSVKSLKIDKKYFSSNYAVYKKTDISDKKTVSSLTRVGDLMQIEESNFDDGAPGKKTLLKEGLPAAGKADNDMDGFFETREVYKNGVLAEICFYSSGALYPEYKALNNDLMERFWDFDGDGKFDCREWNEEGFTMRSYSLRSDGGFDVSVKIADRKIVKYFKDGLGFDVIYDSLNNVFWIGKGIPDFKGELPRKTCTVKAAGKIVSVTMLGDDCYAEVIE